MTSSSVASGNFPTRPRSRPSWTPRNGQLVPVLVWQFKNGSTAPVWAGDDLPDHFFVATDRSLGCLVAYER